MSEILTAAAWKKDALANLRCECANCGRKTLGAAVVLEDDLFGLVTLCGEECEAEWRERAGDA